MSEPRRFFTGVDLIGFVVHAEGQPACGEIADFETLVAVPVQSPVLVVGVIQFRRATNMDDIVRKNFWLERRRLV